MTSIQVAAPTFEQHHDGFGVSSPKPRISWRLSVPEGQGLDWQQDSYDVEINIVGADETYTGTVQTPNSLLEPWPTRALNSAEEARVRVRCHGSSRDSTMSSTPSQSSTDWSPWATIETALLEPPSDWKASMITAPQITKNDDGSLRPLQFSTSFQIPRGKVVRKARLYITAQGCYHATINGQAVGDHCMAPGWQSYKHRLHYQVFDVKALLSGHDSNVVRVEVAPGWFASALAWTGGRRCMFGDKLGLLAQLNVSFEDDDAGGITMGTDEKWQCCHGSVISSEIYNGEVYDMGVETQSQDTQLCKVLDFNFAKLESPNTPPVKVTEEIHPLNLFKSASGQTMIDFGQNLVGRLRVTGLKKPPGHVVRFRHAEVMENDELGVRPLRDAKSTDTIVCNGQMLEDWNPRFTFHGFRYVEVTGWEPEDVDCPLLETSIVAQVMHSDMKKTGWFSCSNPLVNKLHENATWSMRGNFLSVPTDCPQRNERLGWTGDIQVFAPSANFLYNTAGMLGNWLEDLAAEQLEPWRKGIPPFVVPDVITKAHADDHDFWPHLPNAVWDDAAVLVPWSLYLASGDKQILERQFKSMTAWVDEGIQRGSDGLWDLSIYQLGDWLDPMAPPSEPGNGRTDGTFVADAYLVHVTRILAEACTVLNRQSEASRYHGDHGRLKKAFQAKYIAPSGLIVADTQTALSLAIVFDLLDTSSPTSALQLSTLADRLARSVRNQQFRVSTGFAGTPIITHALSRTCYADLAYRMVLEKNCPSWMYPISMGATTIWERWDSMLPDGSINPGDMTSFNHYALGSVVNWLHGCVGGIKPLKPGWKEILVRPVPGGGMRWAKVAHDGPYGRIECSWELKSSSLHGEASASGNAKETFRLEIVVPPNSTAKVILPSAQRKSVAEAGEEVGRWVSPGRHVFEEEFPASPWPPSANMPPFWPQKEPVLAV